MCKNKGYMIVRYSRYTRAEESIKDEYKASGRRLSTYPDYKIAKIFFKQDIEEIELNPNFSITDKDLRKGYIKYQSKGCKLLLALMPYSNQKIEDILL